MKTGKFLYIIIAISILIIYLIISSPRDVITSIEKMISKELKTKHIATIFNVIVIDDYNRLASYVLKNGDKYEKVGYAYFRLNNKGSYELIDLIDADNIAEKANNIIAYEFLKLNQHISSLTTDDLISSLFIISNNPKLAKIERIINDREIQTREVNFNPSIIFFQDIDEGNKEEYVFYDKEGNIIK
ncbi:MAG: hypothetical protein GX021_03085 [Tissierellia bacterium]|nr:hypothetical protein [Tissierellia bacterium]